MLNRKALLFKFLKCRGREFGSTANRAPFPAPPHLPQRRVVVTGRLFQDGVNQLRACSLLVSPSDVLMLHLP